MISFRHTIQTTLALLAATAAPTALAASILVNTLDDELNDDGECTLDIAPSCPTSSRLTSHPGDGDRTGRGWPSRFAARSQISP
jgi:hypothetical protein